MSAPKTIHVLVVDDNPLVRQLVVEGLASLGEIIAASDGADALLKAIDAPPDLIITDYRMPGLDGRQLYEKLRGREASTLVLLDSRGKQLSSEEFAEFLRNHQDRNPSPLMFAVGPANGFTAETRQEANLLLSLGKMTLAHELARVVLLEQLYRAFTILKGHPYHLGH